MGIVVCKFGGTSTADAGRFKMIAAILSMDRQRRYIVLSAPGEIDGQPKITDMLFSLWHEHVSGGDPSPVMGHIVQRFSALAEALGLPPMADEARQELKRALEISQSHTVSRGEYLCAKVFSRFTGIPMVDARDVISFDIDARLDRLTTCVRLWGMSMLYPRAVIPGFYGSGPDGSVVTFSRNGSDITGALVAAGTGASLYENWTDVEGLMTEDPATHPEAEIIPEISYAAMRAMAEKGARVLHPDSLAPVEAARIPTRICCTMAPLSSGTLIHA